MPNASYNKGELLIAEPSLLGDQIFTRSVILLNHCDASDVVGFILNRPSNIKLSEVIPGIKTDFELFVGGPVEEENLYFIHKVPHLIPNSIKIDENIYWGGKFECIENLINNNLISPKEVKFFLGYTGWTKPQLDQELVEQSWIPNKFLSENELFSESNARDYWKNKMRLIGGDYALWSNAPDNPNHN